MKKDFEFICTLMNDFVRQAHIKNTFNVIKDQEITGWETWFQIEFATFLSKCDSVGSWEREVPYRVDKRKKSDKDKVIVDFKVRRKHTYLNRMITIEFKQHTSITTCLTNMISDLQKIESIQSSSSCDMRSYWSIGIHPKKYKYDPFFDRKTIKDKILEKSKYDTFGIITDCILTRYIPKTNFAYTIF